MAPGILLFGWVADRHSPHTAMSIATIGYFVAAIAAALTPAIRDEAR